QTESVIYVVQRTELLMGLFYVLTLYCAIRGSRSARPWFWHTAAVAACALGMASKEVMVSAPLIVLLYDRVFISGSFRGALARRPGLYAGLALTWVLLGVLLASGPRSESIGFNHGVASLDYLRTQAGVILWYLRLCLYPHPLVISYDDWPLARSFGDVMIQGLGILALLAAAVWALIRRRPVGFLGAWFFLLLAPTSSVVPIVTEIAAERRMYLALVAPVAIFVALAHRMICLAIPGPSTRRVRAEWLACAAVVAVGAVLGCLTYARAKDYRSDVSIWADTVNKRPQNALAQVNLGNALFNSGRVREALGHYEKALQIKPGEAKAHYNLANALVAEARVRDALPHYEEAIRIKPRDAHAHYNLGIALSKLDRTDEEIEHYLQALRIDPNHVGACNNLGLALVKRGEFQRALQYYYRALQIDPDSAVLHRNLGDALLDLDRLDEAVAAYRKALAIEPNHVGARCNLGIALAMQNRKSEAIAELREALRLDPNHAGARRVLEDLLAEQPSPPLSDPQERPR
ncbi:MAG: tetratricopeptide repeat protein, partial [Planctomycetota bacterium]